MPDANKVYSIDQIIDKTLIAVTDVKVYNTKKQHVKTFSAGQIVGKVYSWVTWSGIIYFVMYDGEIVEAKEGNFNVPFLVEQGAKSVTEQAIEAGNKETTQFNFNFLWAILLILVLVKLIRK